MKGQRKNEKELFIEKSNIIHNNKYDYSLVEYVNNKTKIKIICPVHGIFEQRPYHHLRTHGCQKCAKIIFSEKSKKEKWYLNGLKEIKKRHKENPEKYNKISKNNLPKNQKKENNGNWKGGVKESELQIWRIEHAVEHRNWSNKIKERDNYICKNCGNDKNIQAHHIINIKESKKCAFELWNGVSLCKKCHMNNKFHKKTKEHKDKFGKRIIIKFIPHKWQEYDTCGNYKMIGNELYYFISDTGNYKYNFLILIHEFIEFNLLQLKGIKEKDVLKYDLNYKGEGEPGFGLDNNIYQDEHTISTAIEMILCNFLDEKWSKYEKRINEI